MDRACRIMDLDVVNIGELFTGKELLHQAQVSIRGGRVRYAGLPAKTERGVRQIDAEGQLVTPGLVEPHAHPIFAGSRANEFDLRAQGKSYLEIQQAGGGILSTVRATRAASDEELVAGVRARLDRFLAQGVTTVEAKSGYDLTAEGELRLLRLLGQVRHSVALSPTLLAHVPEGDRDEQVRQLVAALPRARGLAEAVDVYCDAGAFTLDETRTILTAAKAHGFHLRAHAEQFTYTGAAELAAELGARSVEHLEQLSEAGVAALARAGTVCNLLPGAALTLRLPWPDARRLLAAGCRVALGTDCNPGSSLTESLPLMMSLACMQMGMSCLEAWRAVTIEAAHAVGRDDAGHLTPGARGDLVIWNGDDHRQIVQHYGVPHVRRVVVAGEVAYAKT
jgi:imidazolonepropionase